MGCSGDYSSPSYSYSSILSKSETGELFFFYYFGSNFLSLTTLPRHSNQTFCYHRLRRLGQPSYDLLPEQPLADAVYDPRVQKCTLQVRRKCLESLGQSLYVAFFSSFLVNISPLVSWEFEESEEDPVTSIPYQLQRLFVLLQTSKKRAIETTDVTRSFGWDSSEGEHPHF